VRVAPLEAFEPHDLGVVVREPGGFFRVVAQAEHEVAPDREPRKYRALLRNEDPIRGRLGDQHAVDQHLARIGLREARHDVQQRGLAASRRADERHELALGHRELHAVDDAHRPVVARERHREVLHRDAGGHR
jgi:hypothetical protein